MQSTSTLIKEPSSQLFINMQTPDTFTRRQRILIMVHLLEWRSWGMQLQVVYCVYLLKLSKLHYKDFSFYCVKDSEYKGKLKLVAETLWKRWDAFLCDCTWVWLLVVWVKEHLLRICLFSNLRNSKKSSKTCKLLLWKVSQHSLIWR